MESICISVAIVSCEYGLLSAALGLFSTIAARKGPLHGDGSLKYKANLNISVNLSTLNLKYLFDN
ncbi:MAG: hypothetical protein VYA21_06450, partial [Verrucomicrobiota bacterium]|nr:hypothetical protein [Verrucomicrobiota bacterium]